MAYAGDGAGQARYDRSPHEHVAETPNGGSTTDLYYSAGWQVIEERVSGTTTARYVWSPVYVDALVLRDRDTDANGSLDERLYALQDANFNVVALVNTSGTVVERYEYDPFGARTILDGSYGSRSSSSYAWTVGFQGMTWDGVSGLWGSTRIRGTGYSPTLGRFITSDPLGLVPDVNCYRFVGNGPVVSLDPSGLCEWEPDFPDKKDKGPTYRNPNQTLSGKEPRSQEQARREQAVGETLGLVIILSPIGKARSIARVAVIGGNWAKNKVCSFFTSPPLPPAQPKPGVGGNGAASELPTLAGKSPADAVKALEGAGFKPTKPEPTPIRPDGKGGWQTFKHPDGSQIDIHFPSGRVVRQAPLKLGPDGHPINKGQRLGPDGAEIPRDLLHK